jgi:hypothetical protein
MELVDVKSDVDLKVELLDLLDDSLWKTSPEKRGWEFVAAEVNVSALFGLSVV